MRVLITLFSVLLTFSAPAFAQRAAATRDAAAQAPASDASIRRLLDIMHARKLVDGLPHQIETVMSGTMQKMLQGQAVSPPQQRAINEMVSKMTALMREDLNWDQMEPLYLKVYRQSFSEAEIQSMIGFYSTPAGQAVVEKLPLVTQNVMTAMQERMAAMMPKIQQMAADMAKQIKEENATAAKGNGE